MENEIVKKRDPSLWENAFFLKECMDKENKKHRLLLNEQLNLNPKELHDYMESESKLSI